MSLSTFIGCGSFDYSPEPDLLPWKNNVHWIHNGRRCRNTPGSAFLFLTLYTQLCLVWMLCVAWHVIGSYYVDYVAHFLPSSKIPLSSPDSSWKDCHSSHVIHSCSRRPGEPLSVVTGFQFSSHLCWPDRQLTGLKWFLCPPSLLTLVLGLFCMSGSPSSLILNKQRNLFPTQNLPSGVVLELLRQAHMFGQSWRPYQEEKWNASFVIQSGDCRVFHLSPSDCAWMQWSWQDWKFLINEFPVSFHTRWTISWSLHYPQKGPELHWSIS